MTTTAPNSFWHKANQAMEQAENDAEAWRPDQGGPQSIAGQVTAISHRDAGYGPYPILTLRLQDDTLVAWHAMGTVAEGLVNDHNVQVGHGVAIAYRGKQTSRSGNEYTSWRLVVFDDTQEATESLLEQEPPQDIIRADGEPLTITDTATRANSGSNRPAKGKGKSAASAQNNPAPLLEDVEEQPKGNDDDIPF
jgi:hypothetical protein